MPMTFVRRKAPLSEVLQATAAASELTAQVANALQFPPAVAVATIVLVILNTVQSIQNNRAECDRLARRAATVLVDISDQMHERWDKAPESLLRNLRKYEETLSAISNFMKELADAKWRDRLWKKAAIEGAIKDYSLKLDEAAQSFQIATLIDIHYTVSSRPEASKSNEKLGPPKETLEWDNEQLTLPPYISNPGILTHIPQEEKSRSASKHAEDLQDELELQDIKESADGSVESEDLDYFLPDEPLSSVAHDEHGVCTPCQSTVLVRKTGHDPWDSSAAIINPMLCSGVDLVQSKVGGPERLRLTWEAIPLLSRDMMGPKTMQRRHGYEM